MQIFPIQLAAGLVSFKYQQDKFQLFSYSLTLKINFFQYVLPSGCPIDWVTHIIRQKNELIATVRVATKYKGQVT